MERILLLCFILVSGSCGKSIEVVLPQYDSKLVVEMYLEDGKPLRCQVSQSVAYADTIINKQVDDLLVVLSDGASSDTLKHYNNTDWETGRTYNYFKSKVLESKASALYSLKIVDKNSQELTATTAFNQPKVLIDFVDIKQSSTNPLLYSVGAQVVDPPHERNYYRFLITRKLTDFSSSQTDIINSDIAFDGKKFSAYSEPLYVRGDSLLVRVYSLNKEHFQFLQSAKDARKANFSVFSQPTLLQTNVNGGTGIFTSIVYDERVVVVK